MDENTQQFIQGQEPPVSDRRSAALARMRKSKIVKISALSFIALAVIAVIVVVVVSNRKEAREKFVVEQRIVTQAQTELKTASEECESARNPQGCSIAMAQISASRTGVAQLCDELSGAAKEDCLWLAAQTSGNYKVCDAIEDAEKNSRCMQDAVVKAAASALDINLCSQFDLPADVQSRCRLSVEKLVAGTPDCIQKIGQDRCQAYELLAQAEQTNNALSCAQIKEQDILVLCDSRAQLFDSDSDGLPLYLEKELGLNDSNPDFDADGLSDGDEENVYGTDPKKPDTDGDSYLDGTEVQNGYNPLGEGKLIR